MRGAEEAWTVQTLTTDADFAPDHRRKHLLWLAVALVLALAIALMALATYDDVGMHLSSSEAVLLIGLPAPIIFSMAYLLGKEHEQRALDHLASLGAGFARVRSTATRPPAHS